MLLMPLMIWLLPPRLALVNSTGFVLLPLLMPLVHCLKKAATGRVAALASGVAQFVVEIGATVTAGQLLLVRKL